MTDLAKMYVPAEVEPQMLRRWEDSRVYHAEPTDPGVPYSIVIPPPNVTSVLHLGHALNNTLQDILIRWRRMAGDNAMWMPGTDHAGIATQTIVDKRLQQEGQPALKEHKQLEAQGQGGREKFIEKVQAWKDEYERRITDQLKAMGCSCDWDRQRFTMDPVCAAAVREAFFQLFKEGLIYRGKRLVNWDPVSQTALADDEVEMEEVDGFFYYLRYPLTDGSGHVTVATTRPETMLGDTAVAINPNDPRAASLRGKKVRLPIVGREIPIVEDDYVVLPVEHGGDPKDPKAQFATGFLKVTPAHDENDYAIGQRHALAVINVMAPDASISLDHGWQAAEPGIKDRAELKPLLGLSREAARKAVVKFFQDHGLFEGQKPYKHSVGHSYRSHVPIEPYLTDQWYVKVTDDRLKGAALRAMAPEQRASTSRDPALASRDREGAAPSTSDLAFQPLNDFAFFLTFGTYNSWLQGDERGSVDRLNNEVGTEVIAPNPGLESSKARQSSGPAVTFDVRQRECVRTAIVQVCQYRGWKLLALNVLQEHVHAVVVASGDPEPVMTAFKAYATRALKESGLESGEKTWARHGSTRYLKDDVSVSRARAYVLDEQGNNHAGRWMPEEANTGESKGNSDIEGAASSRARLAAEGQLRFYPQRYARTFEAWHENIRDWCISRQLWWGHRIPVWHFLFNARPINDAVRQGRVDAEQLFVETLNELRNRIARYLDACGQAGNYAFYPFDSTDPGVRVATRSPEADEALGNFKAFHDAFRLRPVTTTPLTLAHFEGTDEMQHSALELSRRVLDTDDAISLDPDVLDTWFSSALWPFSTLGWPEQTAALQTWNPTNVLCTAREIITLWVSRMVMMNVHLLGRLPFRDVFIHAMIQDGEGQKMSKSLGNGVDPLDIIHTHGSDALRFTLALMTTQTQDVRLPVDLIDPHSGQTFTPKLVSDSAGYRVMAPIQESPAEAGKKMVTSYGVASGKAQPTPEMPLARNTSSKFDIGRNFANKLWNAVRFALGNLEGPAPETAADQPLTLADRWILSRLAQVIRDTDAALSQYEFNRYVQNLYDFTWRDLCDWYIEAVKPTVKQHAGQRRVLASCIDAVLRLLHPVMPFVTERLWERLSEVFPQRGLTGLNLPANALLIKASWPQADAALIDPAAEQAFELVRKVVSSLREMRTNYKVAPKVKAEASIRASAQAAAELKAHAELVQTLANVTLTALGPDVAKRDDAASAVLGEMELYLHGVVDTQTERTRIDKRIIELEKSIAALNGRLSNRAYVDKAPANLVQQTRDQLTEAEKELAALRGQLAGL